MGSVPSRSAVEVVVKLEAECIEPGCLEYPEDATAIIQIYANGIRAAAIEEAAWAAHSSTVDLMHVKNGEMPSFAEVSEYVCKAIRALAQQPKGGE